MKKICPALTMLLIAIAPVAIADSRFTNATEEAGVGWAHDYLSNIEEPGSTPMPLLMAGGVAAGDYDKDGDTDLYLVTGDAYPNVLLRNDGTGRFSDVAQAAGVDLPHTASSGPVFADIDGDGWQDLVVGGTRISGMRVFRNAGDGTFTDITENTGIVQEHILQNDYSTAFGDPDGDGDLDMYVGHWGTQTPTNHFWINRGDGTFYPGDVYSGVDRVYPEDDWSFSPAFVDFNSDGRQDLLVASDFITSRTLVNTDGLHFEDTTTAVIDDRSGMGTAIGDFDNDGDFDWFVTSIWWGPNHDDALEGGNRLYENDGTGTFSNVTEVSGVREGDWGWGACAADFDNDGWLDLFHVNGFWWNWDDPDFSVDRSRLFMNTGDGTFLEQGLELGIDDTGQGRGTVCFDADHDGDIDIFSANVLGNSQFFRNELEPNPGWLQVRLEGEPDNPWAVGARVELTTGEMNQVREVRIGSNFLSQDPLMQHFGLGGADQVDRVRVTWPHGGETVLENVQPNQVLTLDAAEATPPPFSIQPGTSAAWFDPDHDGEGFVIEVLEGGLAVVYWFTYDQGGNQDWYIAVGRVKGRRIVFPELLRVSGGRFGPGFDPGDVTEEAVGTAAFTWTGCDTGFMDWTIGPEMGRQQLTRLTRLMGLDCGLDTDSSGPAGLSGAFFDLTHAGEGYTLEVLANGQVLVFWFSFDPNGNRRWFYGVGEIMDGSLIFEDMRTTSGGIFGNDFDPQAVQERHWGRLELQIDCNGGSAMYASEEAGFGDGSLTLTRLTSLASLSCG